MDKNTLSQYGWVTIVIIIIIILLGFASPFGQFIKNSVWSTLESFRNASGIEDIATPPTNYSEDDITNNEHIYGIGATKPEYVTAVFNDDFTEITITRNGTNSDGLMMNWTNPVTPSKTPMYEHKSTLKKIVVESGVKNIGNYACYQCAELEELQLPEGLTEIGGASFYSTTKLKNVAFPDSLETIGAQSFRQSGITSANFPDSLKTIGAQSFRESGVTSIKFGSSLESIDKLAFYKCSSLTGSLSFPDSLKKIEAEAFSQCTSLDGTITFGNSLESIGGYAFNNDNKLTGSLIFPKSLKYIYYFAFQSCGKLNGTIELNEGLIHIGDGAFNHCIKLTNTSVTIPSTLKTIGGDYRCTVTSTAATRSNDYPTNYEPSSLLNHGTHVFYNCAPATMQSFIVAPGNTSFKSIDGVLFTMDEKRLVAYPSAREGTTYIIPEGVEIIDECSFNRAAYSTATNRLSKLVLPNSYVIKGMDDYENTLNRAARNSFTSSIYQFIALDEIIVKNDNPRYTTIDGCLYTKDGTTLLYVPGYKTGTITIPEGVTTLEYGCFSAFEFRKQLGGETPTLSIPSTITTMYDTDFTCIQKYVAQGGSVVVAAGNPFLSVSGNTLTALQTIPAKS